MKKHEMVELFLSICVGMGGHTQISALPDLAQQKNYRADSIIRIEMNDDKD